MKKRQKESGRAQVAWSEKKGLSFFFFCCCSSAKTTLHEANTLRGFMTEEWSGIGKGSPRTLLPSFLLPPSPLTHALYNQSRARGGRERERERKRERDFICLKQAALAQGRTLRVLNSVSVRENCFNVIFWQGNVLEYQNREKRRANEVTDIIILQKKTPIVVIEAEKAAKKTFYRFFLEKSKLKQNLWFWKCIISKSHSKLCCKSSPCAMCINC